MPIRLSASLLVSACLALGCLHAPRPQLGEPRTVMAGMEVKAGQEGKEAPELTFDFGDGSPPIRGTSAAHAYARAGSYQLRALRGEEVLSSVKLEVVPRPLLSAVPAQATSVVYLPKVAGHLEAGVDFMEKLLGAEAVQTFLEESVLPALAMELSSGEGQAVDPQEGLGLFTLPQLDGTVALLGVIDGSKAQAALISQLERQGGSGRMEMDGTVRIALPTGRELTVLLDRGYLYVVLPEVGQGEPASRVAQGVVQAIRAADAAGLTGSALIARSRARLPSGDLYLFMASPPSAKEPVEGLFATVTLGERAAELDGLLQAGRPLWAEQAVPSSSLLSSAPQGAIAALHASVPPAELTSLIAGNPQSERREKAAARASLAGVKLEALLEAFSGSLAALVYFDAEAFLSNLASGSEKPEPRGALLVQVGLRDEAPLKGWLATQLAGLGLRLERAGDVYRGQLEGQPVELHLDGSGATLRAGTGAGGRPKVDLGRALGERFQGAFGPGHVSAMVDLGRLRDELAEPRVIDGIDPRRLVLVQGFASAFLSQLTPVDHLFLDLSPDEAGARIRGSLSLRPR